MIGALLYLCSSPDPDSSVEPRPSFSCESMKLSYPKPKDPWFTVVNVCSNHVAMASTAAPLFAKRLPSYVVQHTSSYFSDHIKTKPPLVLEPGSDRCHRDPI